MMDAAKKNMYGMASLIALISQLDSSSTKSAHHLWELDLKMFDASSPLGAHKSVRSPARPVSTCSRPQVRSQVTTQVNGLAYGKF